MEELKNRLNGFEGFKIFENMTGGKNFQIEFHDKYAEYIIVVEERDDAFYLTDFYREEKYDDGYSDTEDLFDYRWSTVEQKLIGCFKDSMWKQVCLAIVLGTLKSCPYTRFQYRHKKFIYE